MRPSHEHPLAAPVSTAARAWLGRSAMSAVGGGGALTLVAGRTVWGLRRLERHASLHWYFMDLMREREAPPASAPTAPIPAPPPPDAVKA